MTDKKTENDTNNPVPLSRPFIKLDPANVPPELHPIIPLAEKWGIRDKALQDELIRATAVAELKNVYVEVTPHRDDIEDLALRYKKLALDEPGSYEAEIFDALDRTWQKISSILVEVLPKKEWLEMVGWPDRFRRWPIDPDIFPPELKSLIPHVEKWILVDDYVRCVVIEIATTEELEELIQAINQIGMRRISALSVKMVDDESQQMEGYTVMLLLELAEWAEFQRDSRDSPVSLYRSLSN